MLSKDFQKEDKLAMALQHQDLAQVFGVRAAGLSEPTGRVPGPEAVCPRDQRRAPLSEPSERRRQPPSRAQWARGLVASSVVDLRQDLDELLLDPLHVSPSPRRVIGRSAARSAGTSRRGARSLGGALCAILVHASLGPLQRLYSVVLSGPPLEGGGR